MAAYIYAGGTPIIRFTPMNGVLVTDASLGTPVIAVTQGELLLTYEDEALTIDPGTNSISAQMSEEDTITMVDGVPAQAQLAFYNTETGMVTRFPIHEIAVLQSILGGLVTEEEEYEGDDVDEDGEPYPEETFELDDGELSDIDDYEDYVLEDYEEDYEDTLEDDPEELFDIDDVEEADTEE